MKVLGRGQFGKVFQVRKKTGKDANRVFAMKVMIKNRMFKNPKEMEHTKSERNILEVVKVQVQFCLSNLFISVQKSVYKILNTLTLCIFLASIYSQFILCISNK